MRGGKLTTHSGAKHGLGGNSFQKGTMVPRKVNNEGLNSHKNLMEQTFG